MLTAAGLLAYGATAAVVAPVQRRIVPPAPQLRPMVRLVMDRTVSAGELPRSGFIAGRPEGFGIFERWVQRLGCFTARREGDEALTGDVLVFLNPTGMVSDQFRQAVARYVRGGGKVLVIDAFENQRSTANSVLYPFGITIQRTREFSGAPVSLAGRLNGPEGWPTPQVASSSLVTGGQTLLSLAGEPVAACKRFGQGTVTVAGFGGRFSDANMGVTGDLVPDPELRQVYDLQFKLLRAIVQDQLPAEHPPPPESATPPASMEPAP